VLVLGHLGNTLEGFREVLATGADGVELDVRRGPDGALVVHHDPVTGGRPADAPLLHEVLELCAGRVVNVEIKNLPVDPDYDPTEEIVGLVMKAIDADGDAHSIIVSSFSLATIDAVRDTAPGVRTALLTLPAWDQARALRAAADRGHRGLHPHRRSLDTDLVKAVHAEGMAIHPWGLDDVESALAAAGLGVDMIITDDPEGVVPALAEQGKA
jgi:glycerophosphoryl diester phosphodiesterase